MFVLAENKMHLVGLKEREVGSFRNLTWFYIPYMQAREGSTVRCEEMDQARSLPFPLFQWVVFHSKYHCISTGLAGSRITGSLQRLNNFPSLRGARWLTILVRHPVANPSGWHLSQAWRDSVYSAIQHVDLRLVFGQWLYPRTSIPEQSWMSCQGSPVLHKVQQALQVIQMY